MNRGHQRCFSDWSSSEWSEEPRAPDGIEPIFPSTITGDFFSQPLNPDCNRRECWAKRRSRTKLQCDCTSAVDYISSSLISRLWPVHVSSLRIPLSNRLFDLEYTVQGSPIRLTFFRFRVPHFIYHSLTDMPHTRYSRSILFFINKNWMSRAWWLLECKLRKR